MFLGVDIGAATAKALILDQNKILGYFIIPTGSSVVKVANSVLQTVNYRSQVSRGIQGLNV